MPCIEAITPSWPKRGMSCSRQVLGVLDAPSQVAFGWTGFERLFEDVQGLAVGAIANRVNAELIIVRHRQPRRLGNVRDTCRVQTDAVRFVAVWLEQPRAA